MTRTLVWNNPEWAYRFNCVYSIWKFSHFEARIFLLSLFEWNIFWAEIDFFHWWAVSSLHNWNTRWELRISSALFIGSILHLSFTNRSVWWWVYSAMTWLSRNCLLTFESSIWNYKIAFPVNCFLHQFARFSRGSLQDFLWKSKSIFRSWEWVEYFIERPSTPFHSNIASRLF